jgi:hypothetical protein
MWVGQYVLLFGASVLLSIGAFVGYSRGFASLLGMFSWFVVGNASVAVEFWDGAGTQHVVQSVALSWLCYGVAAIHFVVLLIAIHDMWTDDDVESAEELADAIDPSAIGGDDFQMTQSES